MNQLARPDFNRLAPPAGTRLLVIGGCGGIGHALVTEAVDLGLDVAIMDLPDAAERRGIDDRSNFVPVDLRDARSINDAFRSLGAAGERFAALALCSGYTKGHDRIGNLDTDRFDDILSGNLRGPALALRAAVDVLTPDASVVVLTTAIGQVGLPGYAGYGAAKSGLNAIIRVFASEMAPRMRVNGVAPGAIDTAFIRGGYGAGGPEHGAAERIDPEAYRKLVPLGRIGVSDDVVGPMLFLMSDSARYITGQVLHVNGGALMRD